MKFIQGYDRNQVTLFPLSLDQSIEPDNDVRLIDLFVDSLNLQDFGFNLEFVENGRPAYHPADLLKLFIYGYLNKIRSSRDLEKESKRNIEAMWLLKCLQPDHNTIANFRRDNPKAIKNVFRATVQIAKNFDLIGGKLIAGDSTKFTAQNSKKNNFNQKKIERHLAYINNKIDQYNQVLSLADGDTAKIISQDMEDQLSRKQRYIQLQDQLIQSGMAQISTSDPDSQQLITRNNITEVAYNVQTTVDAKHNLIIDYKVTNQNDSKAMGNMVRRAKSILGTNEFTVLYDKGFHTGSELKIAQDLGVETIVAIPAVPSSSQAPDPAYNVTEFVYNHEHNHYTCPQGKLLRTNGSWYKKNRDKYFTLMQHFKTNECRSCAVMSHCTRNPNGRLIERSEFSPYYEQNRKNVDQKESLYKRRQAIVEHPYGTIKRQWGFSYILTKRGMDKASSDVGLMFIAYNLKRLFNILGKTLFTKYLKDLFSVYNRIFDHLNLYKAIRIIYNLFSSIISKKENRFQIN